MRLQYVGGKTDHKKYAHVYFLGNIDGWLPKEKTLDEWLKLDYGQHVLTAYAGFFIVDITGS